MAKKQREGQAIDAMRRFGDELSLETDPIGRARALAKVKAGLLGPPIPREHGEDRDSPAASASSSSTRTATPSGIERYLQIGRYLVLERLGAGGMGVVHLAFDLQLERRVAIKLVRSRGKTGEARALEQARLIREGQSQARLSHPNVVAVHDVELVDDQVVLVMEYVEGRRLDHWLERTARDNPSDRRRPILELFLDAGRGLAAAHAAELVHRDFKPSNVIVDTDGRARVLDFGLALSAPERGVSLDDSFESIQSLPGAGTPRYMAPEQRDGEIPTAASDQYAFCVALWEALFEIHPAYDQGRKPRPRALARVLARGLEPAPHKRWPSMEVLLQRLEPFASKRRALLGGGGMGLTIVNIVALAGLTVIIGAVVGPGGDLPHLLEVIAPGSAASPDTTHEIFEALHAEAQTRAQALYPAPRWTGLRVTGSRGDELAQDDAQARALEAGAQISTAGLPRDASGAPWVFTFAAGRERLELLFYPCDAGTPDARKLGSSWWQTRLVVLDSAPAPAAAVPELEGPKAEVEGELDDEQR